MIISAKIVTDFFTKKGYVNIEAQETGRSFVGTAEKNGKIGFFKYPKSANVSIRLRNEAVWYETLHAWPTALPIYTPALLESGEDSGHFWLVRENLPEAGRVADADKPWLNRPLFKKHLGETIDFLHLLTRLEITLPNDNEIPHTSEQAFHDFHCGTNDEVVRFVEEIGHRRASKIDPETVRKIIEIIRSTKLESPSLTFTDYKPWHFFLHGNQLALIDAENANNLGARHFDVAFYFTAIHGILNDPELANRVLGLYTEKVENKATFPAQIRSLLARTSIAALDDAITANKITTGHRQLIDRVINNTIL